MRNAETIPYDDFIIGSELLYPEPSTIRVGGGTNATITSTHSLRVDMQPLPTEDELDAIRRGDARIWFIGKVIYRDVFSRDDRTTAFCYSYSGIEANPGASLEVAARPIIIGLEKEAHAHGTLSLPDRPPKQVVTLPAA